MFMNIFGTAFFSHMNHCIGTHNLNTYITVNLGCTLEARAFQRDIENYRKLNAQIVGVSVDPPETNAQFCSAEGLDFYMLSDTGGRVSKLYGTALSLPGFGTFSNRQTYIIDPNGNLRYVFTDVESRIPRHSGEVLEKLSELEQATA